ncbi:hypothetical protein NE237_003634 [Protea cynaroides]|uniref:Uncharacterized protein n=1 Tax=Protea cynaroides TaxID=273540 RepID=A0A9Q0KHG2_9MAGN|nr:hypothetical protein NE237_003634 [Protea cynaroides]
MAISDSNEGLFDQVNVCRRRSECPELRKAYPIHLQSPGLAIDQFGFCSTIEDTGICENLPLFRVDLVGGFDRSWCSLLKVVFPARSHEALDTAFKADLVVLNTAVSGKWLDAVMKDSRTFRDVVVLPYKDSMLLFSWYLQQLVMESVGKEFDLDSNGFFLIRSSPNYH